jgi:hypothetical protein
MNKSAEPIFRTPSQRATPTQTGGFVRTMSRTLLQPQLSRDSSVSSNISRATRTRSSSLLGPTVNDDSPQSSGSGASSTSLSRPLAKHNRAQSTSSVHLSASAASSRKIASDSLAQSLTIPYQLDPGATDPRDSRLAVTRSEAERNRPMSYLPPLTRTASIRLPGMQEKCVPPPPQYKSRDGKLDADIPAVSSWSNARPLYRCIAVAEFRVFDRIHYAGLPFLMLAEGEIIEYVNFAITDSRSELMPTLTSLTSILHECGRVDDFANIPIDVGVADDGLLVARDARQRIGLILCSFLEPLTQI